MATLQTTNDFAFWQRGHAVDGTGKQSSANFDFWKDGETFLVMDAPVATATAQIWPYLDTGLCASFVDMGMGGL